VEQSTTALAKDFRRWQIRILVSTWLAYAGYYFCRKAFYTVKGAMGDELGLSAMDLAHLGTAYLVGYAIGQFSSAFFGRKLGPKVLLLVGMGVSIGCNLAFGIQNGFWTMLVFMALNGMAQGTGWPGCIGSLGYWFKREQRGSILGVWSTCYQVGSVVATAFAAFMLGTWGWRWSFMGASTLLLMVWALVLFMHPNTPEHVGHRSVREDDEDESEPAAQASPGKREPLGWSRDVVITVLTMGAIYFCIKFLRYALWSWTPYFLSNSYGMEEDQAGYLSTVFDMAGFAGVLMAGWLSDKWLKGRRSLLSLMMLIGMTGSFVLMYLFGAQSIPIFAVTMGLCGFMLYGPDSLLSGVGAIDVGSVRGALVAAGLINGMGSIGPIFQEQLVGWMYEASGGDIQPILTLFVFVAAAGTGIMLYLHLRARAGKSQL